MKLLCSNITSGQFNGRKFFNSLSSMVLICLFVSFTVACKKAGTGGKATVQGTVAHHDRLIPNAVVYVKFGASEFPGPSPDLYDMQVNANLDAFYTIEELHKGDYYLYGVGYDSSISQTVQGGIPIKINSNDINEIDVPVTED